MSIDQEKLIEIARECGAVIDVLCMGRHDNVVFTSGEIQRFVQRIEQPYVDTIEDLHDEIGRLRAEIADLKLKLEASDAAFLEIMKELLLMGGGK